ncbi:AIR synthase family protein [Desulfoscipio gibsoniae]
MIGKVNDNFFTKAILPETGALNQEVIVGPRMGVDAAILKIGDRFMAVAEDPIFPGPTTSPEDFGWITVHIGASDVAVTGIKPRFMTYSLLIPPETSEEYISRLVRSISASARELGIAIVGGHTGFYGAVTVPTIGGITVWGMGREYITPAGARVGDAVLITKGAAIEAAALLGSELGGSLREAGVAEELIERAAGRIREITVVEDAILAAACGGVHAMHDATEGGLARGLWEVAQASGVGLRIRRPAVILPEDIKAVCSHFQLNPFEVISEGTLVLTVHPERAEVVLNAYQRAGLAAAVIGEVVPREEGCRWVEANGSVEELLPPPVDRFWEVFFGALAQA